MFAHQRQGLLAAVKNRIDIDGKAALPVFKLAGLDIAGNADPGIVDEYIQSAKFCICRFDRALPIIGIGYVMLDAICVAGTHFFDN